MAFPEWYLRPSSISDYPTLIPYSHCILPRPGAKLAFTQLSHWNLYPFCTSMD